MKNPASNIHIGTSHDGRRTKIQSHFQLRPLTRAISRVLLPASIIFGAGTVLAAPQNGQIQAGAGSITHGTNTIINQTSKSLVARWDSFNVGADESVRFIQPSASAAALNRILDQNPSQILGSIDANGRVFLMNPNGVIFGESARVNVGSLAVTGFDISNDDFMKGKYDFKALDGKEGGAIINYGTLTAATGGSITLASGTVRNEGVIVANYGQVNLASGRRATLDFEGDGLLKFAVDGDVNKNPDNITDAVANTGKITADGGQVLLQGRTASGVFTNVINNTGIIRANGIKNDGGKIRLIGMGGTTVNSGTLTATSGNGVGGYIEVLGDEVKLASGARLDASGSTGGGTVLVGGSYQGNNLNILHTTNTQVAGNVVVSANATTTGDGGQIRLISMGGTTVNSGILTATSKNGVGGRIEVLGNEVALTSGAKLDASGSTGGGTVLVGGDYQGKNSKILNATNTYVAENVIVRADATDTGKGGTVIVWANDTVQVDIKKTAGGKINARGGPNGGDGGFIEVSGKKGWNFDYWATGVDVGASQGRGGTFLLDPNNITISNGTTTKISDGTNDDTVGANTTTTNDSAILKASELATYLTNTGAVQIQTASVGTNAEDGNITVSAAISWTGSNSLTLTAENNVVVNADIANASANVTLTATAGSISGTHRVTAGALTVDAKTGINLKTAVTSVDADVTTSGDLVLDESGSIEIKKASIAAGSGNIDIKFGQGGTTGNVGGTLTVASGATITTDGGTITFTGGAGKDTFTITTGVLSSSSIDGGGGTDTLDFTNYTNAKNTGIAVMLGAPGSTDGWKGDSGGVSARENTTLAPATVLSKFDNMDVFIGSAKNDIFVVKGGATNPDAGDKIDGLADADILSFQSYGKGITVTFGAPGSTDGWGDGGTAIKDIDGTTVLTSFDNLNLFMGSAHVDTFDIKAKRASSSTLEIIYGQGDNDVFNVTADSAFQIFGEAGTEDTVKISTTLTEGKADGGDNTQTDTVIIESGGSVPNKANLTNFRPIKDKVAEAAKETAKKETTKKAAAATQKRAAFIEKKADIGGVKNEVTAAIIPVVKSSPPPSFSGGVGVSVASVGLGGVGIGGVGVGGVGAAGVGATGVGGVGATGVGATGVGATGVGATGVGATGVGGVGIGGVGATGVGATGVGSTGVGATGVGATGVGSTGVGATGVGATGVGATGVGSTGVGSTGVGSTGVGSTGVGSTGVGSTGVGATGVGASKAGSASGVGASKTGGASGVGSTSGVGASKVGGTKGIGASKAGGSKSVGADGADKAGTDSGTGASGVDAKDTASTSGEKGSASTEATGVNKQGSDSKGAKDGGKKKGNNKEGSKAVKAE
uniref:Filamentous hemagglutinin family N-terminal domain-containing protein n=1 Tax=Candidatus Kentrum sp. FW TaxID=2126338 RepID=A0A450SRB7_9GAMM|nr:MAG: filamentous hemagglutinin family N-terminal domain-containing protein [Candidatus Kentron sp. FW]